MSFPSVCPDCGSLLEHTKEAPGGADAAMEVSCPDCPYEETFPA